MCPCVLQVQLLVSEQDVENYKQIKTDLDQLRLTVEKSELWVEKSSVYSSEDLVVRQGNEENIEVRLHHVYGIHHLTAKSGLPDFTVTLRAPQEVGVA